MLAYVLVGAWAPKERKREQDVLMSLDKRVAKGAAVRRSPMVGGFDISWYDPSWYAPSPVKQRWARFELGRPLTAAEPPMTHCVGERSYAPLDMDDFVQRNHSLYI
jgi:hypothetical protein